MKKIILILILITILITSCYNGYNENKHDCLESTTSTRVERHEVNVYKFNWDYDSCKQQDNSVYYNCFKCKRWEDKK